MSAPHALSGRAGLSPNVAAVLCGVAVAGVVLVSLRHPTAGSYVVHGAALISAVTSAGLGGYLALVGPVPNAALLRRVVRVAAVVGVAAVLLAVGFDVMTAAGAGLRGLGNSLARRDVLRGGAYESALTCAVGLVAVVAATLDPRPARARGLAVVGAALVATSFSLDGHARSHHPVALSAVCTVVHVAAAMTWVGGLLGLATTFASPRSRRERIEILMASRRLLRVVVAGLVAAGVGLTVLDLPSADALLHSAYGQVLLIKLALVVALLVVSGANHVRIAPALASGHPAAERLLRMNVAVEQLGLLAVLVITAVLTQQNATA